MPKFNTPAWEIFWVFVMIGIAGLICISAVKFFSPSKTSDSNNITETIHNELESKTINCPNNYPILQISQQSFSDHNEYVCHCANKLHGN